MAKSAAAKPAPDVHVGNHGSIFTFEPRSAAAREWIADNVQSESWQWIGGALSVDHRYAQDLAQGMLDAGLVVV